VANSAAHSSDYRHPNQAHGSDKVYETGLKCAVGFKKKMKIVFDKNLPKWNYRAVPQPIENRKLIPARS
jgi:hypothetical protein